MLDKANIFNIPANYHFFESLYIWLEKNFGREISAAKIFLPNRRSCRELRQLFLDKNFNGILPQIKAISDISHEDLFDFLPNHEAKNIINEALEIKVLDGIDYLFFLSNEIQKLSVFGEINFEQAFKIALRLKDLFDEIEREEIDLKLLDEIDDSNLSKHRQLTLDFLRDFYVQIRNSLLKKNIFFASAYQNFIIQKFLYLLEQNGSRAPLIIAGSTGSISFGKKLIKGISKQKNGFVILHDLKEENFAPENHPQFFLNQLVEFLEVEKKSVKNIAPENLKLSPQIRQDLLSLMMLPNEQTTKWQNINSFLDLEKIKIDLQNNFQLIEAKNEIEEAKIIALILLESLRKNQKTALITNNEKLVEFIRLELQQLNLPFNDARNLNVFNSKLIEFLLLIFELRESDFNSHILLALLKHPLCFYAKEKEILAEFEIKILRQDRVSSGLAGIKEKLKSEERLKDFFEKFSSEFEKKQILKQVQDDDVASSELQHRHPDHSTSSGFSGSIGTLIQDAGTPNSPHRHPELVSGSIRALIQTAQNLSKKTWRELLENEPAQVEIFEFFEKLKQQNYTPNSSTDFKSIISQISYFQKSDAMAPIQILSTIEARLLNFDLVIISSLNQGDFPQIESENWLGKKIKKDLGINRGAKKIGQSAYDFCNYLSNASIVLTRCKARNGEVLIESPFLLKFKTICKKIEIKLNSGEEYFALLKNLNSPQTKQIEAPNPKPKKENRPQKISITEISKLLQDPYFIYAKKILQLRKLEKIDYEPNYAEFGSFIHKALEEFLKNPQSHNFEHIFEKYFLSKDAKLIWWPKFENIFADFLKQNEQFLEYKNMLEFPVKMQLGEMEIVGKIDRVIIDEKNNAEIFDYKTGQVPSAKDVASGLEPQLTIAALMLNELKVSSLNYWKLSSSKEGEIKKIVKDSEKVEILIAAAKSGLERLFKYFADEKNGYIASAKNENNDYKNLARIEQWNK